MKDWKFLGTLINELNKDLNKKKRLNQPPSESNNQEGSLDQVVEDVNEDHFLEKLYDVIYKLSIIARTQSFRFKKEWDLIFTQFNPNPHLIRAIDIEKDKFLTDLLKENFSEQDQLTLKYFVAFKLLGDLVQYNMLDHETVPLKYNILASNYLMIKLKGLSDTEIMNNMIKIRINLTITDTKKYLNQIEKDGFIKKQKKGRSNYYNITKELILSKEGEEKYNSMLRPLIDWPTGIWKSFYNIRSFYLSNIREIIDDYLKKIKQ